LKLKTVAIIVLASLVIALLSIFIAYNYFYLCIDLPENFIYLGKTINTSELYHADKFTWVKYKQIHNWETKNGSTPITYITVEWSDQVYNGTPAKRYREYYTDRNGTPIQITDTYWDSINYTYVTTTYQAYINGTLTNTGQHNNPFLYKKTVPYFPDGYKIAPRGTETITVGNKTFICDKYYLPNQVVNNTGGGYEPAMYWFNDSTPVPVKVQPTGYNIVPPMDGYVIFELVDWGYTPPNL